MLFIKYHLYCHLDRIKPLAEGIAGSRQGAARTAENIRCIRRFTFYN